LLFVVALAFLLGHATAPTRIVRQRVTAITQAAAAPTVVWRSGIPVGVADTQAGALAFADNYLSVEESALEAQPALFARLLATDDSKAFARLHTTAAARLRQSNPSSMRSWQQGAHGVWLIPAHKLAAFTPHTARVVVWGGGIAWGAGFSAQQNWSLSTVTLHWAGAQWQVTALNDNAQAAPIPSATPQATRVNTQPGWFSQQLAGFTTVPVQ
jgi:hypothetical protein